MAPLSPQNASIVFVHGAWHSPFHYAPLLDGLRSHGWTVRASQMPSIGSDFPDLAADIAAVRHDIDAGLAEGKDVAVLAHSWGGVPASEAVEGYVKDGDKPGVAKLMYICAFAVPKGESLASSHNEGKMPDWQSFSEDQKSIISHRHREIFYSDCDDDALVEEYSSRLKPQSTASFITPVTWEPYRVIDSAYVYCKNDKAIQAVWQEQFIRDSGIKKVVTLDSSHSPWIKHNDELLKGISEFLGDKLEISRL